MKNKHKTLIAAAAMQGIMLGFWSVKMWDYPLIF